MRQEDGDVPRCPGSNLQVITQLVYCRSRASHATSAAALIHMWFTIHVVHCHLHHALHKTIPWRIYEACVTPSHVSSSQSDVCLAAQTLL